MQLIYLKKCHFWVLCIIQILIYLTDCQSNILGERRDIEIINLYLNRAPTYRLAVPNVLTHSYNSRRLYLFLFDTLKHQDDSVQYYMSCRVRNTNTWKIIQSFKLPLLTEFFRNYGSILQIFLFYKNVDCRVLILNLIRCPTLPV